jgi:hypothetical protein
MSQERWVSWYEAIGHLLPECKAGKIPAWVERDNRLKELPEGDFMIKSGDSGNSKMHRDATEPAFTLMCNRYDIVTKTNDGLKVLNQKARALLQSFPAWYTVPENGIGQRGTGNAVPPLFYQKLLNELGVGNGI